MTTCLAHVPHVLFHELITTVFPLICASLNTSLVKVVPFPNDAKLRLKNNNVRIIGTADTATRSIYDLQEIDMGIAVIIGAEGEGVSKSLLESCDDICSIPIYGSVECLNVAVATGITLYYIKKLFKKNK